MKVMKWLLSSVLVRSMEIAIVRRGMRETKGMGKKPMQNQKKEELGVGLRVNTVGDSIIATHMARGVFIKMSIGLG